MKSLQQDTLSAALPDTLTRGRSRVDLDLGSLYEPPPLSFTFETIGWSILAAVFLIGGLVIIFFLLRKHIRNRYRREALQALRIMQESDTAFSQTFVILKQVAMKAFGREAAGSLYGREWLQFLEKTGKNVKMLPYQKQFEALIYRGEKLTPEAKNEILSNAKKWVKTHGHSG